MRAPGVPSFLLESARPDRDHGRETLFGAKPALFLYAKGADVRLWERGCWERLGDDPFLGLRVLLERARSRGESEASFPGLVVGHLGYDLGGAIERLTHLAVDDDPFPDLALGVYGNVVVYDHAEGRHRELVNPGLASEEPTIELPQGARVAPPPARNFSRATYIEAVRRVKDAIRAGEVYEVNLSQRFAGPHQGDAFTLYRRLREGSPAPYAAYLELGERALVSSSPEEFLRVRGGRVVTRPIKGTRPRGWDAGSDRRLEEELRLSAKDDAELVMIVDLMRNDLGRVCRPGSVRVAERKVVEAHPTLWHLSATVEGELVEGADLVDLLRATFPGGSITGAPKVRAMEIIDALEPTRRGAFTGSLVCIGLDGDMRSSVAIRTMQVAPEYVTFQAGGAVVWDSDPAAEYEETLFKAAAMARACGVALDEA